MQLKAHVLICVILCGLEPNLSRHYDGSLRLVWRRLLSALRFLNVRGLEAVCSPQWALDSGTGVFCRADFHHFHLVTDSCSKSKQGDSL